MIRYGWRAPTALLVVSSMAVPSCSAPTQDPGWFPPDSTVHAMLEEAVAEGPWRGFVVGLLDGDGSRRVISYGHPDPDARPLDAESVFDIGSMTKVFTGVILADMVRVGEVDLEDPVEDHLPPDVRVPAGDGRRITLLDLSTHHSGLPANPTNLEPSNPRLPWNDYTPTRLYDFLAAHELQRDPGSGFVYSNVGVALLGAALAERAGTTYEELVTETILRPLEMSSTGLELSPSMRERRVQGYDRAGEPIPDWDLTGIVGAGGLRSDADDMLTFAGANLSATTDMSEARSDLTEAMRDSHRPRRSIGPDPAYPGRPDLMESGQVGLNWFVTRPGERTITWTAGLSGGHSSFLGLDLDARRAVVVLSNTGLTSVDHIGFHLLDPTVPVDAQR